MTKKNLTLVVLAAGMGSRYGGLKQLDTFTEEGDTIIDFSLFDAIAAGFNKVVFIIRKNFEQEFKHQFDQKLAGKIIVSYVFQEIDAIPEKYQHSERTKPWGTGHALLMAKSAVQENFAIINADDFYGKEAFFTMAKKLKNTDEKSYNFSMIGYTLKNTLSDFGYVSRGECNIDKNGFLVDIIERTRIEKIEGQTKRENSDGIMIPIDENTKVSMNFWGFTPQSFKVAEHLFTLFLEEYHTELKAEFYIPSIVNEVLKTATGTVAILESEAKWFGVTYSEDKEFVKSAIRKLKEKGVYPKKLWN